MIRLFLIAIFLIITFLSPLNSKKILIVKIESAKNYTIKTYYYDFTEIDYPYFMTLTCKDFEIPYEYEIDKIIDFLLNKVVLVKSNTESKNFLLNDNIILKTKIIIDTKYKVLEKNGKKYYIFNVCYPDKKNTNIIKKIFKWLM